jgi:hypothetical protein
LAGAKEGCDDNIEYLSVLRSREEVERAGDAGAGAGSANGLLLGPEDVPGEVIRVEGDYSVRENYNEKTCFVFVLHCCRKRKKSHKKREEAGRRFWLARGDPRGLGGRLLGKNLCCSSVLFSLLDTALCTFRAGPPL